jgi:hypothetical protein
MSLNEQAAKHYNWTSEYCGQVILEYERFIQLKANNQTMELIPSDDIEKMWQLHILNTEIYYSYCMSKFNKIIHHVTLYSTNSGNLINPLNLNMLKKENYIKTINLYGSTFGDFLFKNVWNIQLNLTVDEIMPNQNNLLIQPNQTNPLIQPNQQIYPIYTQNKPDPNHIKIYINYFIQHTQQPQQQLQYDKQIIQLAPSTTDTILSLKDIIVTNLGIKKEQINIKVHPLIPTYLYSPYLSIGTKQLNEMTLIKTLMEVKCDFFIIEINDIKQFNQPLFVQTQINQQPPITNFFQKNNYGGFGK